MEDDAIFEYLRNISSQISNLSDKVDRHFETTSVRLNEHIEKTIAHGADARMSLAQKYSTIAALLLSLISVLIAYKP